MHLSYSFQFHPAKFENFKTETFLDQKSVSVYKKTKFAGQKLFSVFGPATFYQFKSETDFIL